MSSEPALFFPEAIASDYYEDEIALQVENPSKENSGENFGLGLRSGIENLPTNFECSGTLVIFHLPQDIRGYSVIFRDLVVTSNENHQINILFNIIKIFLKNKCSFSVSV